VLIRPLKKDEFDIYRHLCVEGFQTSNSYTYDVARRNEILYTKEGWHFYLASVDNEPAGVGVLFIKDEVAILTDTSTIPKFRNLGIQKLLIKERIKQARKMNCNYIVGQTCVGSTGQLNMEKMGMKIAYTKAIWNRQTESI
jgi:GNAT superfamily N-acetyltransferase